MKFRVATTVGVIVESDNKEYAIELAERVAFTVYDGLFTAKKDIIDEVNRVAVLNYNGRCIDYERGVPYVEKVEE